MPRTLIVLLLITILFAVGCDNFTVIGGLNQSTFNGTVSIVHLTTSGDGTHVTFVTLVSGNGSHDFNFCGNVVNQFPMNSSVQGSFTPGTSCGTIVRVTVTS